MLQVSLATCQALSLSHPAPPEGTEHTWSGLAPAPTFHLPVLQLLLFSAPPHAFPLKPLPTLWKELFPLLVPETSAWAWLTGPRGPNQPLPERCLEGWRSSLVLCRPGFGGLLCISPQQQGRYFS